MNKIIKQIKTVMLGHAIRDALGVPVEFESRSKLERSPVTEMFGFGSYPVPIGTWSDDTSMSLAALDSLASGKINHFEIMTNFAKWLKDGEYTTTGKAFDVGHTCLKAIHRFTKDTYSEKNGFIMPPNYDVTACGLSEEYDNGNGSLMRIHPFALMIWFDKRLMPKCDTIIDNASSLTHAHERSKLACRIYTLILFHLLSVAHKGSVMMALQDAKRQYWNSHEYRHYLRLFSDDFDQLPIDKIKSSGYVVDTLEAAVWCVLTTNSYKECVLKAVNLGEDTDTVAAIAGGLAGALYGYDAIPKDWLETLKKREYIEEMCERAANAWLADHPNRKHLH